MRSGAILTLAALVGLLLLAIIFMVVGWDVPEGGTPMSTMGWIAMIVGVVATLGLGGSLMFLVFYSNRHGRD